MLNAKITDRCRHNHNDRAKCVSHYMEEDTPHVHLRGGFRRLIAMPLVVADCSCQCWSKRGVESFIVFVVISGDKLGKPCVTATNTTMRNSTM